MWGETRWLHVVVGTYRSWDFGDERGFRSRKHRIHSSGDYKNRPPKSEHEGLREHFRRNAPPRVEIPERLRKKLGAAFVRKLIALDCQVIAASVAERHGHFLVEMPYDYNKERFLVGKAKNISSYLVRDELPGRVWAAGGRFKLIKDRRHQLNVFTYISKRQERGAWTWTMFQKLPEEE
jgi:REP element-mobilizing transposase RayT